MAVDRARVETGIERLRPPDKDPRGKRPMLVGLGVLGLVGAAAVGTLVLGGGSGSDDESATATADAVDESPPTTTEVVDVPESAGVVPATSSAGNTSSDAPVTTTVVPVAEEEMTSSTLGDGVDYSYHEAVYRDGQLFLLGYVPSQEVADALSAKAAEVIGATNVMNQYVVDSRAPEITDGQVRVDEPFLFRPGSAALDPQYTTILDLGVAVLAVNPQATMLVVGHTDDLGTDAENDALSLARAQAVVEYMVSRGASPSVFQSEGRGEREPVADNTTEEGRRLNRRIEVAIVDLLG